MNDERACDYGPLVRLFGTWRGSEGTDIAPEPDGSDNSPYYETIAFSDGDDVENAEQQMLAVVHYRQVVHRKSNDKVFHDQTGYWMWDAATKTIMHGFAIPRGVVVLAGGRFEGDANAERIELNLSSSCDSNDFGIAQSPFMRDNAKTLSFSQQVVIEGNSLSYSQTTVVDIYGKVFEHTDENRLVKA